MNILRQSLGFWKVQEIRSLDTTCIALYSYLIRVCNDCRRQNPFKRRNDKIEGDLGISRNTLIKARESLSECGLISFRTQNGVANVEYTLSNIDEVLEKLGETLSDIDELEEKTDETLSNNDEVNEESSSNIDKVAETLSETLSETSSNFDNHNIKEKVKNNNKENNKKKEDLKPYQNLTGSLIPTKDDVINFFFSNTDLKPSEAELRAESFYSHFSEKGWIDGKSIIFDWTEAAENWKGEISNSKDTKEADVNKSPQEINKLQKSKIKGEIARFKVPTVDEVEKYCKERNNNIDAQHFVDHYTANGWMRGKTKIKDWKACVRTWEQNNKQGKYSKKPNVTNHDNTKTYEQF